MIELEPQVVAKVCRQGRVGSWEDLASFFGRTDDVEAFIQEATDAVPACARWLTYGAS